MADAIAAPAAVPGTSGTFGNQSATGTGQPNTHPEAKPGETKAQTVARIKADLGDGEREYEQKHVLELARRGMQTAKTMSKAEQRYQEAQRERAAAEAKVSRLQSKDLKERRAALKELGLDELELARAVAEEVTSLEQMDPKDRQILEYQKREAEREAADKKAKDEAAQKERTARQKQYEDEFSNLFMDVTQRAGLPRESASVAAQRLALMYQAADGELDPDVAAERLKDSLRKEHTALYRKPDGTLDLDAFEASLTPEDWKAINRRAVEKYRASRGIQAPSALQPRQEAQPEPPANGRTRGGNYWKDFDKRLR